MQRTAPTADELTQALSHQEQRLTPRPDISFLVLEIVCPSDWDSKGRVNYEPHGEFTVTFNRLQHHESVTCSSARNAADACIDFIEEYFETKPGDRANIHTTKQLEPAQ